MTRELVPSEEELRPQYPRSLGWLALRWIDFFVVHGPGDIQGRPIARIDPVTGLPDRDNLPLDDELAQLTVHCYLLGQDGRRLFDSVFFSRAKGRDKSGHAARIGLFEALGPCRFAGWAKGGETYTDPWGLGFEYRYVKGEPMGRPVTYPFLRCMATEEGQTGNVYGSIYLNLTEGPLSQVPGIQPGVRRTVLPDGGEIVPSTAGSASKDGGKETWVDFDETHLYVTAELRAMYDTVRRNCGKRKDAQPWSMETSTMYLPGEGSVAEDSHTLAQSIREKKARSPRFLFDHREAPPDVNLEDEDELVAALEEAYGEFADVMDLDRIVSEIWDPRNSPQDSRRYWLNQATSAEDAWIAHYEWAAVARPEKVVADRETITLGFDGSRKRARGVTDATALIACRVSDGHIFQPLDLCVWEQPDGPAGADWQVPAHEVEASVDECFRRYNVVAFFADPAKWESYVAGWEAKYGKRLKVKATREHPIEWWMTGGRALHIVRALEQFHSGVVDGELSHDGTSVLTRHVLNARRRPSRAGLQIGKENPDSPRKIDAAVAAVLAWEARLSAVAAGAGKSKTFVPKRVR